MTCSPLKALEDRAFLERAFKRVCSPLSLSPACSFPDIAAKMGHDEELGSPELSVSTSPTLARRPARGGPSCSCSTVNRQMELF